MRVDPKTEKNVMLAGRNHVWMSDDRGRTFERNEPGGVGVHDIRGVAVSGNGKDGMLVGGVVRDDNGKFGKALRFDGTSGLVDCYVII